MIEATSYMDKIIDELEESIDQLIDTNDRLNAENKELKQEVQILVDTIRDLELKLQGIVN